MISLRKYKRAPLADVSITAAYYFLFPTWQRVPMAERKNQPVLRQTHGTHRRAEARPQLLVIPMRRTARCVNNKYVTYCKKYYGQHLPSSLNPKSLGLLPSRNQDESTSWKGVGIGALVAMMRDSTAHCGVLRSQLQTRTVVFVPTSTPNTHGVQ